MVKYSVIIPTRDRFAYLNSAIESCLASDRHDIEVIVSINGNTTWPEVIKVYQPINDDRVRYVLAGQLLSMQHNFNFGITQARGEYVTTIGDDDALLPSAFAYADNFFTQYPDIPLCWFRRPYFWPDYEQQDFSNLKPNTLHCWREISIKLQQTKPMIEACCTHYIPYYLLPSIYNSFYPAALIDRLRSAQAELEGIETQRSIFLKQTQSVDVFTAYASLLFVDSYGLISIPLSLSGISGRSNGGSGSKKQLGDEVKRNISEQSSDQANAIMTGPLAGYSPSTIQIYNDFCKAYLAYSSLSPTPLPALDCNAIAEGLLDSYIGGEYISQPWCVYEMMRMSVDFDRKHYLPKLHEISVWYASGYEQQLESWWKDQRLDESLYSKISDQYIVINCDAAEVSTSAQAALLYQKVLEGKLPAPNDPN